MENSGLQLNSEVSDIEKLDPKEEIFQVMNKDLCMARKIEFHTRNLKIINSLISNNQRSKSGESLSHAPLQESEKL